MRMNKVFKIGVAALLSVTLVACGSTSSTDTDMSDVDTSTMTTDSANTSATTTGAGDSASSALAARELSAREEALATRIFYFEFDRSDLDADARLALVYHANRLKDNPSIRVRLEGHADERGTREYNIALGERRAQAVARYLQVQGVPANQIETVSYGEESPIMIGSSSAAYSRNRRVEMQ